MNSSTYLVPKPSFQWQRTFLGFLGLAGRFLMLLWAPINLWAFLIMMISLFRPSTELHFSKSLFFNVGNGSAFGMYELHINLGGIPMDVQVRNKDESKGHPASFMILLRLLFNECRPKPYSWSLVLQNNLSTYMNGTHRKVKHALNMMTRDGKAHVREIMSYFPNNLTPYYPIESNYH
jgi:hypothetical protein